MFPKLKTYSELHGLGTGSTELARNDNLATLGTALHDEAEDTIAGSADGKTVQELVAERLALSDGGQTTVLDLGGVERDRVLGELEALLNEGGELADAATLFTENLLGVGGTDDCRSISIPFLFLAVLQIFHASTLPLCNPTTQRNANFPFHRISKSQQGQRTDIGHGRSDADLDARVTLLSKLALEELVQFGVENTVGDELATLGNNTLGSSHDCRICG